MNARLIKSTFFNLEEFFRFRAFSPYRFKVAIRLSSVHRNPVVTLFRTFPMEISASGKQTSVCKSVWKSRVGLDTVRVAISGRRFGVS